MKNVMNPKFNIVKVREHYSVPPESADALAFLTPALKTEEHVNIGYSKSTLFYVSIKSQLNLLKKMAETIMSIADSNNFKIKKFLDVACGHGGAAIFIAKKYKILAYGVDLTPYSIKLSKIFAKKHGVKKLTNFRVGNAIKLPFKKETFDACWMIESPHIPQKEKFIGEVYRVLNEFGVFAFADLVVNLKNVKKNEENMEIYMKFMDMWDVPYLETFESYKRKLVKWGFEIVSVEDITNYNFRHMKRWCSMLLALLRIGVLNKFLEYYARKNSLSKDKIDRTLEFLKNTHDLIDRDLIRYGIFFSVKNPLK